MRFLIDNNLSPNLKSLLNELGEDALHVGELEMSASTDEEIFDFAFREKRTIISADTDFGFILSEWKKKAPSIILFRYISTKPEIQIEYLKKLLLEFKKEINEGSLLVVEPGRVRIKNLPY